jgi:DNA polymerase-3 subunit gamma/tau
MFTGIRGTGKTSIARILGKELGIDPIDIREIDGASNNSIDNIRDLVAQLRVPPMAGKRKMYIIDEVHMLSNAAFNGLLKSIEEPPKYVYFVLCTTEPEKVIKTIRSRCLEFQLNTIQSSDIVGGLEKICKEEEFTYDKEALYEIANRSEGSLRDSITLLDSISANGKVDMESISLRLNIISNQVYYNIVNSMLKDSIVDVIVGFNQVYDSGADLKVFIADLAVFIRDLLMAEHNDAVRFKNYSEEMNSNMIALQRRHGTESLIKMLDVCHKYEINYEKSYYKRLHCELLLSELYRLKKPT